MIYNKKFLYKNKNADFSAFGNVICLGHCRGTPTQETFREKFLGTSKAFAKIK